MNLLHAYSVISLDKHQAADSESIAKMGEETGIGILICCCEGGM